MAAGPPPVPIRGNRLEVTEKMLRGTLMMGGITGSLSSDLTAVCRALAALEVQRPQMRPQAEALSAAFNRWLNGNHPGELQVLMSSAEFHKIRAFVAPYPVAAAPGGPPPGPTIASNLRSIGVALYTVRNWQANWALSIDDRLLRLRLRLQTFQQWLDSLNQATLQADNAFTGIFVAPEYYFTEPDPAGERKFLDIGNKNRIDYQLKQLSEQFPKILIVPGTIHYDVELTAIAKEQAGYQLLKAAKDRILRENALATPGKVLTAEMSNDPSGPFSRVPSMNAMAINLTNKNTRPRKVHNATSLLLNGRVWGTYDKHTDFYEAKSISPDLSMFVPGTQDECPEIGDGARKFRFGVEVCFDHGNAVLKRRRVANLHFHVVVSDWVNTVEAHMAMRNSGYFLHASTNIAETKIYRRDNNGQLVNETANLLRQQTQFGRNTLALYLIQLPLALPPPPPPRPPRVMPAAV
jgi:hypothetical protein